MRQALFSLRIAGAWTYRVILTDEPIDDEGLGLFDARAGEILLAAGQSAQTAAGTLCHEFVHAWEYHIEHDRRRLESALREIAATTPGVSTMLGERAIESKATMIACYMAEASRLGLGTLLARHFAPEPSEPPALPRIAPATTGEPGELVYETDEVPPRLRTMRRCECPRCGKVINGNRILPGEPRFDDRSAGWVRDHAFPCDDCRIAVKFVLPVDPDPEEPLDPEFDQVQIVEGAAARELLRSMMPTTAA